MRSLLNLQCRTFTYERTSVTFKPNEFTQCWLSRSQRATVFHSIQSHVECNIPTGCLTVNCVTFLDFPNVIGPNGSNSDGETSHFAEVVWRSKQFIHRSTAATVGYWDKSWWTDGPSKNMFLGRLTVKTYLCLPALSVCLSGRIQTTSGVAAPLQGWVEVCGGVDVVLL